MSQLKLKKMSNKQLIESALNQIEQETGFHIIDIEYGDTYFVFTSKEDDTICHFHIKEIPGFKFAFWNTCRFDKIEDEIKAGKMLWSDYYSINSKSELIFFTQFERDLDKFKPSRSGFVTGIWREAYQINSDEDCDKIIDVEDWNTSDIADILNYIKKHRIKAIWHASMTSNYIWDEISYYRALKDHIKCTYYHYKYKWQKDFKKYICKRSIMKVITKIHNFNILLIDRNGWHPSLHLEVRRKNIIKNEIEYQNELDSLYDLYEKSFYDKRYKELSFQCWQVDLEDNENLNSEEKQEDKDLEKRFKQLVKNTLDKKAMAEDEDVLLYYDLENFK